MSLREHDENICRGTHTKSDGFVSLQQFSSYITATSPSFDHFNVN